MIDFDDEPDQEKRIEKLRAKLQELGDEISHESDLPADMEEEFLKHILEFETAEQLTLMQWLENAGVDSPEDEENPALWPAAYSDRDTGLSASSDAVRQ